MKTALQVSTNTFWQIAGKAVNTLSGLIIIALISRAFGQQGVGYYTLILGYISFFFMPVDFGLNAIAVKHLLDKNKNSVEVFNNILGIRILIGAIVTLLAIFIAYFLPYDLKQNQGYIPLVKTGITLLSITILAQAILATSNAFFQARLKYFFSFATNAVSALFNTLLIIYLTGQSQSLLVVMTSFALSGAIGSITSLLFVYKDLKHIKPLKDNTYWLSVLKETYPLTISLILNLIYFRIDSLILPFYRSINEVGHYNVAYKIFESILVIPNYLANALYPVLLTSYQNSITKFISLTKKSILILGGIALVSTIGTYILAPFIVQIIVGEPIPETIYYTRILTSGLIFFFLSSAITWSLIVINQQKYLAIIYATTMTLNILLNALLIPQYGAQASAIITIATEALVLLLAGSVFLVKFKNLQ